MIIFKKRHKHDIWYIPSLLLKKERNQFIQIIDTRKEITFRFLENRKHERISKERR